MLNNPNLEIMDCTIRDGGYVNNWEFDRKLVRETYRALSKAGVDYIELGYHGSDKYFDPQKYGAFRFCRPADLEAVCGGINGARIALMVDHGRYDLADLKQYIGTPVKLIRLAFHRDKTAAALREAMRIKELGFKVSANFMGFASYTPEERAGLFALLKNLPLDYGYVADTYGSMYPEQMAPYFSEMLALDHIKWGFHPHNNLQMAFANSLAAIGAGAGIVDSSVYGMGRGAGNLPTEIILAYLQLKKPERYNAIPVMNLIDHYFLKLRQDHPWGYELPYMVSGIHGCHPDYAKNLVERKEYDMEDIWNILEMVKAKNLVGFKKDELEQTLKSGSFGRKNAVMSAHSTGTGRKPEVSYAGRHRGRDFLVLANGPSLQEKADQLHQFIERYRPVVLGANYLGGLFRPDYHAFSNKRRFVDYIDTVSRDSRLLIGEHIPEGMVREYTASPYETIYYEDISDAPFAILENVISANCRTVSLLLTAVAIIMGAERIFIAGLDGYMGKGTNGGFHFYREDESTSNEVVREKHEWNLRYLQQIDDYLTGKGREGLHIITPTGYRQYYKGIENYLEVSA